MSNDVTSSELSDLVRHVEEVAPKTSQSQSYEPAYPVQIDRHTNNILTCRILRAMHAVFSGCEQSVFPNKDVDAMQTLTGIDRQTVQQSSP